MSLPWFVAGLVLGYEGCTWAEAIGERRALYFAAKEAARQAGKPLLVVGIPRNRHGRGDAVIDLFETDGHPNTYKIDVTDMSLLPDGMFGAAFVSHVLEHIPEIEKAMAELERVADQVFVAFPWEETIIAWTYPDHRHIIQSAPPYGPLRFMTIR